MIFLSFSACAQSRSLDKFYDKYKSSGKAEASISFSPSFMLSACFQGKEKEKDSEQNWLKKVTMVRLLILDKGNAPSAGEWSALAGSLRNDNFEEMVSIRKGKDRLQLLSAERNGGLKEMVFLAAGEDGGGLFLHFKGHFTAADLEKMQSALQEKDSQ